MYSHIQSGNIQLLALLEHELLAEQYHLLQALLNDLTQIMNGNTPEDIKQEQQDLNWADSLVFIYPIWWFDRPALLKGWIDKIFSNGFAFEYTPESQKGLLKHKKALAVTTTGGNEENYRNYKMKYVVEGSMTDATLISSGIQDISYKTFYSVPLVTDEERKEMLNYVKVLTSKVFNANSN